MKAFLILGNQLFDPQIIAKIAKDKKDTVIYMREDIELCTYYKFHKHKIIFFLAAMRQYADELKAAGFQVHYEKLEKSEKSYEDHFFHFLKSKKISEIYGFEIEDKFFEKRILQRLKGAKIKSEIIKSPLFLNSRESFKSYLAKTKKPFMKNFYEAQRKNFKILVDKDLKPAGGQWSFDSENRLPLPKNVVPPQLPDYVETEIISQVKKVVQTYFKSHPGHVEDFWLPVDRKSSVDWLDVFLKERLENFGPYEDALSPSSTFVFHSVLTPFLNVGLLTPDIVVQRTLLFASKRKLALASVEGFIRQIIGWREFVHGIYQNFSEKQDVSNHWHHQRKLSDVWYNGHSGIPPLDSALTKTFKYSYAHHIERLMVFGSFMLLLEVKPTEAHKWFMEMFIDSSDWVMGPNVYGMALFSDGGIFATKPYICGSNYYRKMGGYKTAEWCDGVDGLYWQFIEKNKPFFLKNPRLSMMARSVEKMDPQRKSKIYAAAEILRNKLTTK